MSKYTISQGYPPTQEEVVHWDREANYFRHHPPDDRAPEGTTAARGWGIPKSYLPHGDAVEHVMAAFKRDVAGVPQQEKLRPEYKWSILSVCMAHFCWFRTAPGAAWVMRFFGVEEVPPFFVAYAYLLARRDAHTRENRYVRIDMPPAPPDRPAIALKIFRQVERVYDPPVTEPYSEVVEHMQQILKRARNPSAVEPIADASPDMYHWVSEHWPTSNPTRTGGYQWAKSLERTKGVLFYEGIDKVEAFKNRAYKLKDIRGGVLWCSGKDIRAVPLFLYFREFECGRFSEHQLANMYRCSSCSNMRACTQATGDHRMCANCFGSIVEKDERPTLDLCTMKECDKCPKHISNRSELVNLKNRLNREVHFPVQR